MDTVDFSFISDAPMEHELMPSLATPAPAPSPVLNDSSLLNVFQSVWVARPPEWATRLHHYFMQHGFFSVNDLWDLATGLKQKHAAMTAFYADLTKHMPLELADHAKPDAHS